MEKEKSVVITGCSSGIGNGLARKFVKEGYLVFGGVRKQSDATKLQKEFGGSFIPVILDVTKPDTVKKTLRTVEKKLGGKGLGGLINCAGIAIYGPLPYMSIKEVRELFEVNTFGPLELTRAFLPLLGMREKHASKPGRIINVSSAAGQLSVPFIGGYSGSKHALEGWSICLRQEVRRYGIEVVLVAPGFVNTSISKNLSNTAPYKNTVYNTSFEKFTSTTKMQLETEGHTKDEAAALIYNIFNKPNPKERYSTAKNKFKNWIMIRYTPAGIREKLLASIFGLK